MTWQTWLLFISSTFFVSATPGSNMLLAFQFGLNYGFKKTLYTLAGLTLGLFILLAISLSFIGWLSQTAPIAFEIMKVCASLYLAYLGLQIWRSAKEPLGKSEEIRVIPEPLELFKTGVWVSLSNPKAILFFSALFPKFLNPKVELFPQYVILTISFFVIETIWQIIYTVSGKALSAWLGVGKRLMWLNRICALIFIGLAMGLLWDIWLALRL
ncbi:threonine transporter RhtB [Pasteurellaceae bacterium LFhippo2]|nr:threonine transporter RhtB [Pasteurellaceae bacterium LFhippo2]